MLALFKLKTVLSFTTMYNWTNRAQELLAIFANNTKPEVAVAKPWVGLTSADLKEALSTYRGWPEFAAFLEARLKHNNGYSTKDTT